MYQGLVEGAEGLDLSDLLWVTWENCRTPPLGYFFYGLMGTYVNLTFLPCGLVKMYLFFSKSLVHFGSGSKIRAFRKEVVP